MKVAYRPYYENLLGNQAFNLEHSMNENGAMERWAALKTYLADRGIEFNTYDVYLHRKEIDIWMMTEISRDVFQFMLAHGIHPENTIFVMTEPPVVLPWGWGYLNDHTHTAGIFLTWNSDLCHKSERFMHYHFPVKIDKSKYPYYRSRPKRNLCLMMHSNKQSQVPGELYSLRREIIEYFTKRGDQLLDLYGHGWNCDFPSSGAVPFYTDLYRGVSPDKLETYSEYSYTFCIDNCVVPGYITYDPILSMSTGTVPIYLPMPDSPAYIPAETYIDFNDFASFDELVSYLQSIVGTDTYNRHIQNGWEFINSEGFYPFTIEKFCEDVFAAIDAVKDGLCNAGGRFPEIRLQVQAKPRRK